MQYLLIDNFDHTQKVKTEKELRDLYYDQMTEILENWKDAGSEWDDWKESLVKEQNEVYTCDFNKVRIAIEDNDSWLKIKDIEVI